MENLGEEVKTWWPVVLVLGQMALGWGQWYFTRKFATKKELQELDEKVIANTKDISGVGERVTKVEGDLRHFPSSKDICGLREDIAALLEANKANKKTLDLFTEYLINQTKGK